MEEIRDRQVVFAVLNPVSVRFAEAEASIRSGCSERGWPEPVILTTTIAQPGGAQARAAVSAGATLVVAAGGDGTVRAVAHELVGGQVDLAIVSIGTANLVAHNLGLRTRRLTRAVSLALDSPARMIDVGRATWRSAKSGRTGLPTDEQTFLVMAGLGNDAATVLATRPEFKRRLGWIAYGSAGVQHLLSRPVRMRVSFDNLPFRRLTTWSLLIANCGRIPGGIRVFPSALPDDGVLDTLEVPLTSAWEWVGVAAKGITGHDRNVDALRYGTAKRAWIIPDAPAPLHLDGDVMGPVTDVHVRVLPAALRVRAPIPRS